MKKFLLTASTIIALNLSATPKNNDLKLLESPNNNAKVVGEITQNSPIELRMDKWVYVKNLDSGKSGWVLKADLEKLTGQSFSFKSRYQFNKSEKMVENLEKHQKKMQQLIKTQETLTKQLFKQLDFVDEEN
jgi:hypothetical protein